MRALFHALAVEEFDVGGVETYAIHRDPADTGAYQIYEQYTNAADQRHLKGPQSREAWTALLARVIAPFERVLLEPLGVFGRAKEVGGDLTGDEAWRFTIRALPESAGVVEATVDAIMDAMAIDEFGFGEVKSYTAHRIAGDAGGYVMYEHFSGLGSARHAKGPTLPVAAGPYATHRVTPFSRQLLHPLHAYGVEHQSWGKTASADGRAPNLSPLPIDRYQRHGRIE